MTPEERVRLALHAETVKWLLNFEWQWLVGFSFVDRVHPYHAQKRFDRLVDVINRKFYYSNYRKRRQGIYWVRAQELHRSGELHFHVLIGDSEGHCRGTNPRFARDAWFERDGLASFKSIVDRTRTVVGYVVKETHRDGFDVSPNLKNVMQVGC